jgi:hypothetical protein
MRSRLAGVYTALFWGIVPFGSLLQGTVAEWLGPSQTFASAGTCCLIFTLLCTWRKQIRSKVRRPDMREVGDLFAVGGESFDGAIEHVGSDGPLAKIERSA